MSSHFPRVLCPVRRPVTTPDCVLLMDCSLVFAVELGNKINFRACLWVLTRPHHIASWGEPLLVELIHRPANRLLDIDEVLLGDLTLRVALADDGHPQTLLSSPSTAQLPSVSITLCLLIARSAADCLCPLPGPCKRPSLSGSLDPDKLDPRLNSLSSSCVCSPDIMDTCRVRVWLPRGGSPAEFGRQSPAGISVSQPSWPASWQRHYGSFYSWDSGCQPSLPAPHDSQNLVCQETGVSPS